MAAIGAKKREHEECEQQQPRSRRVVKDNKGNIYKNTICILSSELIILFNQL
jgi:hypothetical protein